PNFNESARDFESTTIHSENYLQAQATECLGDPNIPPTVYSDGEVILLSILTMLLCSLGLFGNLTVILVIWKDRVISKHRQNLYLLSLAVADASLVVLVVPFSLTNELLGHWPFGAVYCRIYLSVDILLCTASIWNICVIGLDRYISVKYPMTYRKFRTMPKIRLFIISVSYTLNLNYVFLYLIHTATSRITKIFSKSIHPQIELTLVLMTYRYIVASCLLSFFVPSFIIWPVYIKIYMIGRDLEISKRARHSSKFETTAFRRGSGKTGSSEDFMKLLDVPNNTNTGSRSLSTDQQMMVRSQSFIASSGHEEGANLLFSSPTLKPKDPRFADIAWSTEINAMHMLRPASFPFTLRLNKLSCANAMSRRERRFVCIISIITGCFMACWMPFFLTYSIYAICRNCCLNNTLFKVFFWLGYLNSALNPVLYTAFNKDFRSAFKRLFRADSNRT
uniref:G-protein coupled receptors family 1 profile domain-containing protein n=1 Tax=Ciona savignyi TaxID=51511 RepID=H2ZCK0_CIOSA